MAKYRIETDQGVYEVETGEAPQPKQGTGSVTGDVLAGVGSGVISLGTGAYDLARKIPGANQVLPELSPFMRSLSEPPPTVAGQAGKFAEQAAEFVIPAAQVARLQRFAAIPGKLGILARAALQGMTAGGVRAVQSGGDVGSAEAAAATAGALALVPPVARAGSKLAGKVAYPVARAVIKRTVPGGGKVVAILDEIRATRLPKAAAQPAPAKAEPPAPAAKEAVEAPMLSPQWKPGYERPIRPIASEAEVPRVPVNPPAAPPQPTPQPSAPPSSPSPPAQPSGRLTPTTQDWKLFEAKAPKADTKPVNFEALKRTEKATKLAQALFDSEIPSGTALKMNPEQWKMAAQGAKVAKEPSPSTVKETIQILKQLELQAGKQNLPPGGKFSFATSRK